MLRPRPVPASSGFAGAGAIDFRLWRARPCSLFSGAPTGEGHALCQTKVCLQLVYDVCLPCVAVCCVPGVAVCRMSFLMSLPCDCSLVGVCSLAGVGVPCCGSSSALNECWPVALGLAGCLCPGGHGRAVQDTMVLVCLYPVS